MPEEKDVIVTIKDYEAVRRMYAVEKLSVREIARRTGFSRNTISKYCQGETMPGMRKEYERQTVVITDAVKQFVNQCLEEDAIENLSKQKHTAKRIFDRLVEEQGFTGGETTIRRLVRTLRDEAPDGHIPLEFDPAEAMQIDFGEAVGYHKGKRIKFQIFCARLCHSAMPFVFAAPRKNMETLLEGLRRAFEFFGGTPQRVVFDNDRVAVKSGFGKNAQSQTYITAMIAHYAFRMDYCNRESGNEKGLVENLVGWSRRNILVPVPRFNTFDDLNALILEACLRYGRCHRIQSRERSVSEQFERERALLTPLPKYPFGTAKTREARVDSFSLIRVEGSRFSVPFELIGKVVTTKLHATKLEVVYNKKVVCVHERPRTNNETAFELSHYLEAILRKPRSILNAKPVRAALSPTLMAFARNIAKTPEDLTRFMRLFGEHDCELIEATLNSSGLKTLEALTLELGKESKRQVVPLIEPIMEIEVSKPSLSIYDQMIPRGDAHRPC